MIRLLNDMNGFTDRYITNLGYLSSDKYPKQKTEALGKWTALRYLNEDNGNYQREINNRFYIQKSDFDGYDVIDNSGFISFFKIVRYDLEKPYKVILVGERIDNSVIVTTKDVFEDIYDLAGSNCLRLTQAKAEAKGYQYYSPNTTYNIEYFVEKYNNEHVFSMKIQDKDIRFIPVYTEYYNDLLEKDYSHLTMDKKEPVSDQDYTLIKTETVIDDQVIVTYKDAETGEFYDGYVSEDYRNRFKFTERMKDWLILNKSTLRSFPDSHLQSFKQYYNVHKPTIIDTPRRAHNLGIVVRADINGSEAETVVIEYVDENNIRFVCQDEAGFFFDTWTAPYTIQRDSIVLDLMNENN